MSLFAENERKHTEVLFTFLKLLFQVFRKSAKWGTTIQFAGGVDPTIKCLQSVVQDPWNSESLGCILQKQITGLPPSLEILISRSLIW